MLGSGFVWNWGTIGQLAMAERLERWKRLGVVGSGRLWFRYVVRDWDTLRVFGYVESGWETW